VDIGISLGTLSASTSSTRYPRRASNRALDAPAQRAPTTITSYDMTDIIQLGSIVGAFWVVDVAHIEKLFPRSRHQDLLLPVI